MGYGVQLVNGDRAKAVKVRPGCGIVTWEIISRQVGIIFTPFKLKHWPLVPFADECGPASKGKQWIRKFV